MVQGSMILNPMSIQRTPHLYYTSAEDQIIDIYRSKLCPRRLIKGHWVFRRKSRAQSRRTAMPRKAGSRFAGPSDSSSMSMDE